MTAERRGGWKRGGAGGREEERKGEGITTEEKGIGERAVEWRCGEEDSRVTQRTAEHEREEEMVMRGPCG